jgi:hypothetical protein
MPNFTDLQFSQKGITINANNRHVCIIVHTILVDLLGAGAASYAESGSFRSEGQQALSLHAFKRDILTIVHSKDRAETSL